jgi:ABC transport system ATP-binding/permease protein
VALKQKHFNEALADWVLDRKEVRQLEFYEDRFIQKKHPIYKSPASQWGRAHFYAHSKRIGPLLIPTGIFNVLVMWLGFYSSTSPCIWTFYDASSTTSKPLNCDS